MEFHCCVWDLAEWTETWARYAQWPVQSSGKSKIPEMRQIEPAHLKAGGEKQEGSESSGHTSIFDL